MRTAADSTAVFHAIAARSGSRILGSNRCVTASFHTIVVDIEHCTLEPTAGTFAEKAQAFAAVLRNAAASCIGSGKLEIHFNRGAKCGFGSRTTHVSCTAAN
jgi:hypothetical protein